MFNYELAKLYQCTKGKKNISKNMIDMNKIVYIEHPSYIYVYKRKNVADYVKKVINICRDRIDDI